MSEPVPIASARDGERVTIAGSVQSAGAPLEAPLGGDACVLYEVHDPDGERIRERDARDFYVVEDGPEARRALVETAHLDADLLGRVREEQVAAIDADINDIAEQLGALKEKNRKVQGPQAKQLHAEMRRLRRIATLLCAMKAQTRGKTHGGMSEAKQRALIERESELLKETKTGKRALFGIDRIEAVLSEGQRVIVTGLAHWRVGVDPGRATGYREAGKGLVLTGSASQPVQLELAASEKQKLVRAGARPIEEKPSESIAPASEPEPRSNALLWVAVAVFVLSMGYALAVC